MEMSNQAMKGRIRSEVKQRRAAMTAKEAQTANGQIFARLCDMPELLTAPMVYCYVSGNMEADTHKLLEFLWRRGVPTAVPRVLGGGEMDFFIIHSFADVEPGAMGILEPRGHCRRIATAPPLVTETMPPRDVVVTPGLAFDRRGNRIGYGGGYYDRFLGCHPQKLRVGLAFAFQLYEGLPADEMDQRVDILVLSGDRDGQIQRWDREW